MPNGATYSLGGNEVVVSEDGFPWVLRLPQGWEVDVSGAQDGAVVARDSEAESHGFHPNLTLMSSPLPEGFTRASIGEVFADQEVVDQTYANGLDSYRLIHLSEEHMGVHEEPAVYRLAMYLTPERIPVTMAQFISRAAGAETTLTATWATADSRWIGNSQAIAFCLERTANR